MASLRQTRPFPSSPSPRHQDPYYDFPTIPEIVRPFDVSRDTGRLKSNGEGRSKSLRKVQSQGTVGSSSFDDDHGCMVHEDRDSRSPFSDRAAPVKNPGAIETRGRKKKHKKSATRSQSTRPRERNDWEEERHPSSLTRQARDRSGKDINPTPPSHTQSTFLIPKSRARSRSRSTSPMPTTIINEDADSLSEDPGEDPRHFDPGSTARNHREMRSMSSPSVEGVPGEKQRTQRSRIPAARLISPLPPQPPTLNLPDNNSAFSALMTSRSPSPAARSPVTTSSLPIYTLREPSRTPNSTATSRPRPNSRGAQANPSPVFSPPIEAPRTLKDVTRRLEKNRGRSNEESSRSESDLHHGSVSKLASPSSTPTPSRRLSPMQADLSAQVPIHSTMRQPSGERSRETHLRPRYGLALTGESGSVLGEGSTADISPLQIPVTPLSPDSKAHLYSPSSTGFSVRPVTGSSSGFPTRLNDGPQGRHHVRSVPEAGGHFRTPKPRQEETFVPPGVTEGTTDQPHNTPWRARSHSRSPLPHNQSRAPAGGLEWHNTTDNYEPVRSSPYTRWGVLTSHDFSSPSGGSQRTGSRRQASTVTPQTSSPSWLPRPFYKSPTINQQTEAEAPTPSATPSFPSLRPSRNETPFSHKPSGSDSSAYSVPRLGKLVIRNPGPSDRPSPSSSSNPETPISSTATTSQDFTLLALSSLSLNSMRDPGPGHGNNGDYIVPDDVAAAISNDDERRRKALAGLVKGLHLPSGNGDTRGPTDKYTRGCRAGQPRTGTKIPRMSRHDQQDSDDDDDDDLFFSRISMRDGEDSLLEEPEPKAEAGFKDDEDEFDDHFSDSPEEYDMEDADIPEQDLYESPLPPTPKFVHPLEDGDDLESRITRVASLHRISTVPLPSLPRGVRSRRVQPSHERKSSPPIDEVQHDIGRKTTQNNSEREVYQHMPGWNVRVEDVPKNQRTDARQNVTDSRQNSRRASPIQEHREDGLWSSVSQSNPLLTDNEVSSVGGGRLLDAVCEAEGPLSSGAEALFKKLQVEADAREANGDVAVSDSHFDGTAHERRTTFRNGMHGRSGGQQSSPIIVQSNQPNALRTWRSTLPFGAYDSLAERHGPSEMRRQEIIWELCETEQGFVKSLRLILRLFVQPLRQEDKTWISGVPRDVTRLFDWFDDIMHLHSQISSALHAARSAQYPVVLQIAEALRPFVPRLELHQPYLVRLESVSSAVEAMSKDIHSDFGEFIRIQTASPECESMNLPSFLLKPVQRLMKYPLFFKQLWEFTPRNHPDHLPTFSLLHSTDMIIRVMQEVKAREEEYELMKNLASRMKGLPAGFQLARRERRLIAQGFLRRVILSDKDRLALDSSTRREPHSSQDNLMSRIASTSSDNSSFAGDWAYHPIRARDMSTSETDHSLHADSIASDATLDSQPSLSRSSGSRSSSLRGSLRHKSKETSVYAFVFTDLIILTSPMSEKHLLRSPKAAAEGKETWKLIDDVGISRVLGVVDHSGKLPIHDHLLTVELMSMTSTFLDTGGFSDGAAAIPIYLSILEQKSSTTEDAIESLSEAKMKWLDAFERCFRFTLRSLSFPSYAGSHATSGTDLDLDTKSSVMSILASGLPLPMSPSQQLGETERGRPTDLVQEEREERGWWSLRFQQVLKEVQRSSRSPTLDATPLTRRMSETRSKRQGAKRSETRPLILSPNPSNNSTRRGGILSLGRKKSK